ncbi:MAG: rhomboid family intramembrane serine protease [Actinobacteria bacterium]|nr:rhomboid family intramembrane serine protease [Actinomycetota bacterium]
MIPFSDETPVRRVAWVTMALVALCIVTYFAVQPTRVTVDHVVSPDLQLVDDDDLRFLVDNAAIPCEIVQGRPLTLREYRDTFVRGDQSACGDDDGTARSPGKVVYLALLISMFLHGSPAHLFGNLLFLWVFGNDIEHRWGRGRFLLVFLLGGIVATLAHVLTDPGSTVPMIGASGAIAAVMGAYLVCYPGTRVKTIIFFGFMMLRKVKAVWLLLVWLALQFLLVGADAGIAWAAHVGGFVFGVLVGLAWRRRGRDREPVATVPTIAPLVPPAA